MTNMLDIGRSGVLAYRTALAVTAENVANVGTEGYRRRDIATAAAGGGQSTPISTPTGGQGVTVVEIRRAFDALIAERARSAGAGLAAAEAHLAGAAAIETLMIPGDDGLDGTLRQFFDAVAKLAASPTDMVTRALALRSGEALAEGVSGLARGMISLRADMLAEAEAVAGRAQGLLSELAQVSQRLGGATAPGAAGAAALHPLADRRDALLGDLARLLPVAVTLADNGRPTIRLGSPAGPLLLEGGSSATLAVTAADQLTLHVGTADGGTRETRLIPEGQLGGISRALGALDMAALELDAFASTLAGTMNSVHRGGVDLAGAPGRDLFATDGWRGVPAAVNGSTTRFALTPTATAAPRSQIELVFDAAAGLWRAHDLAGTEIATGRETLLLPGVRVDLAGPARNGDRITLVPTTGRAADMRFAVSDPAALAAAGAFATATAPGNAGTAGLAATMLPIPASAVPLRVADVSAAPVDLLGGLVGLVPAGTLALDLVTLGRTARTTLPPLPGATRLDVSLDGIAHLFDVGRHPDSVSLASALNAGALRSDAGLSLASLGLTAAVDADGGLLLARPGRADPAQAMLSGPTGSTTGIASPAEPPGGTIQIITRNGVHVSGTPLSAIEAAALLKPQNGFLAGAVYDPSPLGASDGAGYRGVAIARVDVPGSHVALLPAPDLQTGPALPLPSLAARNMTLADASGASATIALPQGASAALIAARLDGALPGIGASASTALELSGFSAGGIRFGLTGANGSPIEVAATLAGPDAGPLAIAINGSSAATGIRAELSPDGRRLLLVQDAGHDIALSALAHSGGNALQARPAGSDGTATGPATAWATGTALRQGGQVTLAGAQGIGLTEGAGSIGARPASTGSHSLTTAASGAEARLRFRDIPAMAEGGLSHSLGLGGQQIEVAHAAGTTGAAIAASLAAALRRDAPDAVLTGRPLSRLPADGSTMVLRLEGADYMLRMQAGTPVITGPEAGRITAAFDADNRLVLTAPGVTGGAGIDLAGASAAFGFGPGDGVLRLAGQAPASAGLPATVSLTLGGQTHFLGLRMDGGLDVAPGFPGTATRDAATGALVVDLPAPAGGLRIDATPATGFGGPGVAVRLDGDAVILAGNSGALGLEVSTRGALGQALSLRDLPPEDLVVLMTGSGSLRLAGSVVPGTPPADPGALELVVQNSATGQVALRDRITGHAVAAGVLDGAGRVTLGGLAMTLTGTAATGDRFSILPAVAGSANSDTALALSALRNTDLATGNPGLAERFARLQADTGLRVAAANRSVVTSTAAADAANRAQAAIGAVDLDVEAARLLELQQAYQASAQAMSIARDMFDTILRMF